MAASRGSVSEHGFSLQQKRSQKARGPRYSNRRNGIIKEEDGEGIDSDSYPSRAGDSGEVKPTVYCSKTRHPAKQLCGYCALRQDTQSMRLHS